MRPARGPVRDDETEAGDALEAFRAELEACAADAGALAAEIEPTAIATFRRLVGQAVLPPCPLARLFFLTADRELHQLEVFCRARPLQAARAALVMLGRFLQALHRIAGEGGSRASPEVVAKLIEMLSSRRKLSGRAPVPRSPGETAQRVPRIYLREACDEAIQSIRPIDALLDVLPALLPVNGRDSTPGRLQPILLRFAPLAQLLERMPELRRIARELGRLEGEVRRVSRPERGGAEQVEGTRLGGSLREVLPVELGLLAEPSTEDLFHLRLTERRLQSLELAGPLDGRRTPTTRSGPVIACIDTSASMRGAPEVTTKALVLALARRVLPKGRRLHLMLFGGPRQVVHLEVEPGPGAIDPMLNFLCMGFHGGTDFDGPLVRATRLLERSDLRLADVLLVTDGLARADAGVIEALERVKQRQGARLMSVVVGGQAAAVARFSDVVWRMAPGAPPSEWMSLEVWRTRF